MKRSLLSTLIIATLTTASVGAANYIEGGAATEGTVTNAVALGDKAHIGHAGGTYTNVTTVGANATAGGNNSTSLGAHAKTADEGTTSIGANVSTTLGATAVGSNMSVMNGSVGVGKDVTARVKDGVSIGRGSHLEGGYVNGVFGNTGAIAIGAESNATGSGSIAVGAQAYAAVGGNVVFGANSSTDGTKHTDNLAPLAGKTIAGTTIDSVVSFGANGETITVDDGTGKAKTIDRTFSVIKRQLQNVAAGEVTATSTDAVNGSQLYVVADQVKTNMDDIAANKNAIEKNANDIATNAGNIANNANNIAGNTNSITQLGDQIKNINADTANMKSDIQANRQEIHKVGAMSAALAGLHPVDFDRNHKFNVAAAGGFYKGESAMAAGAFYRPNDALMFSLGTALGNSDNMYNVGVSYKFGSATETTTIAKDDLAKLYTMIDNLTNRVNTLEANK